MAEDVGQEATAAEVTHHAFAGFWRRALALVIDLVLSAPLYYGIQAVLGAHTLASEGTFLLVLTGLYVAMFSGRWQASPGMRMMGVIITDAHGQRISHARALWWMGTSLAAAAIIFAAMLWLQWRFDLDRINEVRFSAFAGAMDMAAANAEVEQLAGMPVAAFDRLSSIAASITVALWFVWVLSIVYGRQKAGFHNWICGTRLLKARM